MTEHKNSASGNYEIGQAVKYKLPGGGVADMEITSYDRETGTYILNGEGRRMKVPGHLMPLRLVAPEEEYFKYPVGSKVMIPKNDYEHTKPAGDRKKIVGYVWGKDKKGEYIILCPSNPMERERVLVTETMLDECNTTEAKVIDIRSGIHDDLKRSE
jgi:hypothetical protein